jgi:hypothetical protein
MANPLKLRPAITFHGVAVAGCSTPGSFLAFSDTRLVAVVTCRDGGGNTAGWYVDIGFGPCADGANGFFDSAEQAQVWVTDTCWNARAWGLAMA